MVRKQKKSFARSKKFDEVVRERKEKLKERAVQKKTGYERDIRTMMRRVLGPVRAAEEGEGEITREELMKIRALLEKLITKTRIYSGSKGVDLSKAKLKIETEKALISEYIKGKRELIGKVDKHGDNSNTQVVPKTSNSYDTQTSKDTEPVTGEYGNYGFVEEKPKDTSSKKAFYKSLGFDDGDDESKDDTIYNPVAHREIKSPIIVSSNKNAETTKQEQIRKIGLVMIDSNISAVINDGIEYLMHYRRRKKEDSLSYADEIKLFIDNEIIVQKHKSMTELKKRGYSDRVMDEFARLFDKEIEINRHWMVRKCLYMSRVLEYRKGSTSSG